MKRSPLKRKRHARTIDRLAGEAWAHRARSKVCALCGARNPQGHHVITQQQLRKTAAELGLEFERLRWDTRNFLALCNRHHDAHHSRRHPVSWSVLVTECPKVVQFARELDLVWWLERTYPGAESEAAA